jgi:hypothetical protein
MEKFMNDVWLLSPSDLTFLWDECPRCFYLKVARNLPRPRAPFPSIFTRIDKLMKEFFTDKSTAEISANLPPGKVLCAEKWVVSAPIYLSGHAKPCYLRGKFDTIVAFEDGSYGVVDFKTSETKAEHVTFYARQLQAYAYALLHPAPGKFSLSPISKLGLLCVEPSAMDSTDDQRIAYLGKSTWLECPNDENQFLQFIDRVLSLLELPDPPPANPDCTWCQYRDAARNHGM